MTQIKGSQIIFSSLICGCLMHSFLGADELPPAGTRTDAPQQVEPAMQTEEPAKTTQQIETFLAVQANKLNIRQIEAGGIGYNPGYTTLETFLTPVKTFDSWLPFADIRGHRFDNGLYAFNAGLGLRYFTPSNCTIWGANVYYDFRQTNQVNFKQIGVGLEALGGHWDYRINGYIPFSKTESGYYHAKFKEFKGNNLIVNVKRKFDMYGVNAEAAYHWMPTKNIEVTGALGPYYFQGKFNKFAAGGQARLKAFFLNAISIEGIASYDNLFKWKGQGQLAFSIPLGPKAKTKGIAGSQCCNQPALDLSLVRPVQRFEVIVADSHKQSKVAVSSGGTPLHFIFVDNDPSATPNGTFENPFVTMDQAQSGSAPGDIIYVFGSPITYGPATAGGNVIVLQDNQQFLGSGIAQPIKSGFGTVYAPATTYPMLSNGVSAPGFIVTLGNNNVVSGFSFPEVDAQFGILGFEISNAAIQNNIFNCASTGGITAVMLFSHCGGNISLVNNTLTCNGSGFFGFKGIEIIPDAITPAIYNIIGNTFVGDDATGGNSTWLVYNPFMGLVTTSYPDQMNLIGNTIDSWGTTAIIRFASSSPETASFQISGNTFSNASEDGIDLVIEMEGACNAAVINNLFINNKDNGIGVNPNCHGDIQVDNNIFTGSTVTPFTVQSFGTTSSTCLQFNNNSFDKAAALTGFAGSVFNLETPSGNTGAAPVLTNVTTLQPGQKCQ